MLVEINLGFNRLVGIKELRFTSLDLVGEGIIEFEGLLQGKDVFGQVVTVEGFGDVGFGFTAAGVTEFSQLVGVTFTSDDGADDLEAGLTGDVRDDVGQLNVHLMQGFLHVLGMLASTSEEGGALAGVGPHSANVGFRMKGALQQSIGMQLLDPLTILDITFASGYTFEVLGIDQFEVETAFIQDIIDGYPVDAG